MPWRTIIPYHRCTKPHLGFGGDSRTIDYGSVWVCDDCKKWWQYWMGPVGARWREMDWFERMVHRFSLGKWS